RMSKKLIVASIAVLLGVVGFAAAALISPQQGGAGGAADPAQDVAAAQHKLATGDFAGATPILEKVLAADPKNQTALRFLGFAYLKQKRYADARAAYGKLLGLQPDSPVALYNTGVSYALEGDRDAAFDWLGRAKATKKIDMTQIQADDDLKSLAG